MVCLRTFNAIWDWYQVPGCEKGYGIYAAENGNPKVWVPGKLYGNIKALEYAFDCWHAKKEPDWTKFLPFEEAYPWHAKNIIETENIKAMITFNGDRYEAVRTGETYWVMLNGKPIWGITSVEYNNPTFLGDWVLKRILGRDTVDGQERTKFMHRGRYFYGNHYLGDVPRRENVEIVNARTLEIVGYMDIDNFNDTVARGAWMENFLQHEKARRNMSRSVGNYTKQVPEEYRNESGCVPMFFLCLLAAACIIAGLIAYRLLKH